MLIPTKTRKQIYQRLFNDGVLVAFKDLNSKSSWELPEVANVYVIKSMQVRRRGRVVGNGGAVGTDACGWGRGVRGGMSSA